MSNDSYENRWYVRQSDGIGYKISILIWFTIIFWALMLVPYWYDQANQKIFEKAVDEGNIVIREFRESFELAELDKCRNNNSIEKGQCDASKLYDQLKQKKMIALDYVEKMKDSKKLNFKTFFRQTIVVYIFGIVLTFLLLKFSKKPTVRFLAFVSIMFALFVAVHWGVTLPHKNIKFYYSIGSVFAILLPLMDYFHIAEISGNEESASEINKLAALESSHKRWSTILSVVLAIVITLIGSVTFNIIDYQTTIFGESFIYNPLLGIVFYFNDSVGCYNLGHIEKYTYNTAGNRIKYIWVYLGFPRNMSTGVATT